MTTFITTGPPETNDTGIKRWHVGQLDNGNHVFLFENNRRQRQRATSPRYMVRIFDAHGNLHGEHFFDRQFSMNRFLKRLFRVDVINMGEEEPLRKVA